MKNYLKYFGIYSAGYLLFAFSIYHAFGIAPVGEWRNVFWLGLAYFVANMAGDIERIVRNGDRA
jgi:4-hydroxybenzoate polyprenyltransferase